MFFRAKAWLGGAGLAAGLVGMAVQWNALVWLAVGLLVLALGLRFLERRQEAP
jgi:membrane protein implicated in regulation of membrane protease activity